MRSHKDKLEALESANIVSFTKAASKGIVNWAYKNPHTVMALALAGGALSTALFLGGSIVFGLGIIGAAAGAMSGALFNPYIPAMLVGGLLGYVAGDKMRWKFGELFEDFQQVKKVVSQRYNDIDHNTSKLYIGCGPA